MKVSVFVQIFFLMICYGSIAQAKTVPLQPNADSKKLASYIRYTPIEDISLSPVEIEALTSELRKLPSEAQHFGPANGPLLVRIDAQNVGKKSGNWILFTGRGAFKSIRIWRLDGNQPELLLDGENKEELKRNLRNYQAFSAETSLAAGEEASFAIIFVSENSTYLPVEFLTLNTFFTDRRANIALVSGVIVGALILTFLNLIFFWVTGKNEFLWLSLAEISFAMHTFHAEGYSTIFFFPGRTDLSLIFENILKCAFAVFMSQFARSFIMTKQNFFKVDIFLRTIIWFGSWVICMQLGALFWSDGLRQILYYCAWSITAISALTLPFIGIVATLRLGSQFWPLIIAWGSLGLFIFYAAIASTGIIPNLPVKLGWAGPIGLFEAIMATFALGLHIRKIRSQQIKAETSLKRSLQDRLKLSEQANELYREREAALASLSDQSSLLYSSGHDMRQVVSAIQSAAKLLEKGGNSKRDDSLPVFLTASAAYLEDIATTSMSAPIAGILSDEVILLSRFDVDSLLKPLLKIYQPICHNSSIKLLVNDSEGKLLISDRALLMRALSNLLSNAVKFSNKDGVIKIEIQRTDAFLELKLIDTGQGISTQLAQQLNELSGRRLRERHDIQGSGTGFTTAGHIIEKLGGSLKIQPGSSIGTEVSVQIPFCQDNLTPCSLPELQNGVYLKSFDQNIIDGDLPDVQLTTLDDKYRIIASYDDSSNFRSHFSNQPTLILSKPLNIELVSHPVLLRFLENQTKLLTKPNV